MGDDEATRAAASPPDDDGPPEGIFSFVTSVYQLCTAGPWRRDASPLYSMRRNRRASHRGSYIPPILEFWRAGDGDTDETRRDVPRRKARGRQKRPNTLHIGNR